MKIVQSLWSKPGQLEQSPYDLHDNKCGWLDKKYNYLSWILSCHQFKKYYDEVELVTDRIGYDLLINKLELPYTSVKTVLDDLNDYHPELWALGKIYAYSIQEKPFIHADGDVYIWKKFDDALENASLLCQNKEEGGIYNNLYSAIFFQVVRHFEYYPPVLEKSIDKNSSIRAINAGIIGGKNIDFYKQYTKSAFEFIDRNRHCLDKIKVASFNIVFEQFLFRALSEERSDTISYMHADSSIPGYFFDFTGVPCKTRYIHLSGTSKKETYLADSLEYRVQADYPDHYYRLMNLLKANEI